MKFLLSFILFVLITSPVLRSADDPKWKSAFAAFAAADAEKPPAQGGILFVGSSIFRQWTNVAAQMAPLPVLNRAFGGSRTGDQVEYFERLIPRYLPKVVVYYCGSNDIDSSEPDDPVVIFARFREFAERIHAFDPSISLVFVASFRSPDRVSRWEQVDRYNSFVLAYCAANERRTFVDLNPLIVDGSGSPRLELFKSDKLHYQLPTYELFAAKLRPVLERVWDNATAKK